MAILLKWQQTWTGGPGNTENLAWAEVWGSDGGFNLSPAGPIAIAGAISVSAPSFRIIAPKNLVQSGALAIAGAVAVTGDIHATQPTDVPQNLVQTGAIGITGVVTASGNLAYSKPYYFDPAGALPITPITGVLTVSGNLGFTRPKDLQILAPLGILGALGVSGNIGIVLTPGAAFNLVATGPIALTGAMGVSGDFGSGVSWAFAPSAPIGVVGTLQVSGAIEYKVSFQLMTQPIALTGVLQVTGDAHGVTPFDLAQSEPVALTGVVTIGGTEFEFAFWHEGLPEGWRVEQFLEEVPNPNYETIYGNNFFTRWTWKGFDAEDTMVAASGSEDDCRAQTLSIAQARYANWRKLT